MKPITSQMKTELAKLGISPEQVRVDGVPMVEIAEPKERRYGRYRSKWEAMYADHCDWMLRVEEIAAWDYEPFSLRLTEPIIVNGKTRPGIRYTPDFVLWNRIETVTCIEIKGYQRNASINRFKMAVDKFPHLCFEMLTRENGQWKRIL